MKNIDKALSERSTQRKLSESCGGGGTQQWNLMKYTRELQAEILCDV